MEYGKPVIGSWRSHPSQVAPTRFRGFFCKENLRWWGDPSIHPYMMRWVGCALMLAVALEMWEVSAGKRRWQEDEISVQLEEGTHHHQHDSNGTKWALLIAGSSGFGNYRHQADVCHAYQLLRKGGLEEKNIVVFMYDDIAYHPDNPHPGTLINHPQGNDVYKGVPKDYTGDNVTVDNYFAALLGDKSKIQGGSGKVIDSGPDDHIFIYYSDHGGPGVLGMPRRPNMYANDFVDVLKQKHAAGTFKEMVIYLEACESGSIFEGLLPDGINIYATTASNAEENSWGTYCPGMVPPPPPEFGTCLGDLYSVSWMEDSDVHNLKRETLQDQYSIVRDRTSNHNTYQAGSHVMQYGDTDIDREHLSRYMGFDPSNKNATLFPLWNSPTKFHEGINQRDADLLYLWHKYHKANDGSMQKTHAGKKILEVMHRRMRLDENVERLSKFLFGANAGPAIAKAVRTSGEPLVDDWSCLKDLVGVFEASCGPLDEYGLKHMRAFANFCNVGITADEILSGSSMLCTGAALESYESSLLRDF